MIVHVLEIHVTTGTLHLTYPSKWANHTNQITQSARQIICEMIGITSSDSKMYYQWGRNMDDLKRKYYFWQNQGKSDLPIASRAVNRV